MSNASQQSGFAIALLLWMIAGMSLMVAAVIHFAHEDTGMAELRVREAKAQALGRGVAYLLLRDALAAHEAAYQGTSPALQPKQGEPESDKPILFTDSISLIRQGWSQARCARLVASSRSTMPGGMSS